MDKRIITNEDVRNKYLPLKDVPKKVSEYSAMSKTNLGDEAIFIWTYRSIRKGTVVGVTLKGIYVYSVNKYLFVKWDSVKEIIKEY